MVSNQSREDGSSAPSLNVDGAAVGRIMKAAAAAQLASVEA
jgi:hypothetical protein